MQVAAVNLLASGGDVLAELFSSSRKRRTVFENVDDLSFSPSTILRLNPPESVIVGETTRLRAYQADAANANIQRAISRTQSLELHLSEVYTTVEDLEELRDLASKSNMTDAQRAGINEDLQDLLEAITARAEVVEFDDSPLLKGGTTTLTISPPDSEMTLSNGNIQLSHLGLDGLSVDTRANAEAAETVIADALANLDRQITQTMSDEESLLDRLRGNDMESNLGASQALDRASSDQVAAEIAATADYIRANIDQAAEIQTHNLQAGALTVLLASMEMPEPETTEDTEPEEEAEGTDAGEETDEAPEEEPPPADEWLQVDDEDSGNEPTS